MKTNLVFLHGNFGSDCDWNDVLGSKKVLSYIKNTISLYPKDTYEDKEFYENVLKYSYKKVLSLLSSKNILIGYSMGGRILLNLVLEFAPEIRDRIIGLVIISRNPGIENEQERLKRRIIDQERAESILTNGLEDFLLTWYKASLFDSPAHRREYFDRVRKRLATNDDKSAAHVMKELSPGIVKSQWGLLSKLSIPTLFISGEYDSKYCEILAKASKQVQNSRHIVIPNAGHCVHLDTPLVLAREIADFIEEHAN